MNHSKPWNNRLSSIESIPTALVTLPTDSHKKIVLGSKFALDKTYSKGVTIMVGTDISGKFHLGHASLLCIAEALKNVMGAKLIVSLNELESIYSRKCNLKDINTNRGDILNTLKKFNCRVHSRIEDVDLTMFSARLWRLLYEKRNSKLFKHYEQTLDMYDTFSVAVMATTPLILSIHEKTESVLMLYGSDEYAHMELIFSLYKSKWFIKEVKSYFGTNVPRINYLLIKNLPDITGRYKMSKTRPKTTIFLDQVDIKASQLKKHSTRYLKDVLSVTKSIETSPNTNQWYRLIRNLIDHAK